MDRFTVRLSSSHKPSGNTKPLVFKNPILTASGTFGYGVEFANYGDLTHLGGIVVKGLSLKPRPGNPLPRVAETPCGMLNAVGLQNDGVESFLKNKLPRLPWHETPVIANLYATSPAEFAELAGILAAEEGIAGLEVNISCPNVKNGGVLFGQDPALAAEVTQAVKKHAGNLPVIVKLSPNVTDITAIAKAAEQAGADAISCINTITGMGVDVKTRKPLLANVVGGLSGPAVKPVALRCVWPVCNAVKIPVIGIGGISMSGLASILLKQHFKVSGSDAHESELTKQLEAEGAILYYGQRASNLDDTPDLVVYTAAIHPDNPEYAAAVAKQIPMLSRAELLGQMMHNFKTPVAISGTHGKTTTTSMASYIFLEADMDPTISVGGILDAIGGNIRVGGHDTFLTEACEYTNSFLHFFPKISVILNIDADHLDFFKDLDDIRHSFRKFAQLLPDDGTLIVNSEIEHLDQLTEGLTCKIVTYGMDASSDYYASNITFDEFAHPSFDCYKGDTLLGHFVLHVPGIHNVSNALASIALADQMGVSMEHTRIGLEKFGGTKRRFEKKGEIGGVTIIDDYAHHPTEIEATLHAAHNYPHKKLWCVFQPHTYTRTKALMDDFAKALTLADHVVLADIYAARETDTLGISSSMLAEKVNALGGCADYFDSFDKIETCLLENCKPGDVLITMGAGDVVKIGEKLLGK